MLGKITLDTALKGVVEYCLKEVEIEQLSLFRKEDIPLNNHRIRTTLGEMCHLLLKKFYLLSWRGERNTDLLFHLFMYSLVDSCMCPDQGSNLQHWYVGMVL